MAELIDREYAKEAVKYIPWCDWKAVGECLDACPTIDPESLRLKGEWIIMSFWKKRRGHHVQYVVKKCSICNFRVKARWENNFCPNCGADMRGDKVG